MPDKCRNSSSPKLVRYNTPGNAHDLTFSCYKRQKFITSDSVRQIIADSVNAASETHDFDIWAWVFMPEHIHLLIFPRRESYNMSEIVRSIKQSAARKIITRIKHYRPELLVRLDTGHTRGRFRFWQDGGGFDRNYWTASRILEQIDYIHMNPVRRGLVKAPIDWKWSSARFWSLGTESPILINGQFIPAEL